MKLTFFLGLNKPQFYPISSKKAIILVPYELQKPHHKYEWRINNVLIIATTALES